MKRIATGLFAAALTVAMAVPAFAAEMTVSGSYKVGAVYKEHFQAKTHPAYDHYFIHQNSDVSFNFTLDEETKVVFAIGTPNSRWGADAGNGNGGFSWGGDDGEDRRLRLLDTYVDWKNQKYGISTRVGLQRWTTPGFAFGPVLFNTKAPGINLTKNIGDVAAVNLGWIRMTDENGVAGNAAVKDEFDLIYLGVPIRIEGMTLLPWGEYSFIGDSSDLGPQSVMPTSPGTDVSMWHAGFTADLKFGDVFVKFDSIYGKIEYDVAGTTNESKGFLVGAKAGMKMDFGTPSLGLWYASGNDKGDAQKGKYGYLPVLFDTSHDPTFWPTSAGARAHGPMTTGFLVTNTGIGTAGVVLALENMSFVERLFHTPRIAYWMGTSEEGSAQYAPLKKTPGNMDPALFFSKKDRLIEASFDSRFAYSKNLNLFLDLGLLYADWNKNGPNGGYTAHNAGTYSDAKWEKLAFRIGTSAVWAF